MKSTLRHIAFALIAMLFALTSNAAKETTVTSPDGNLKVILHQSPLGWTVTKNGAELYTLKDVSMVIGDRTLAGSAAPKSIKQKVLKETISPFLSLKYSTVESHYTQALLSYGNYSIEMRVMNNAVCYRFVTHLKGTVEVKADNYTLIPADGYTIHRQPCISFNTSFEEEYLHSSLQEWQASDRKLSAIPCLLSGPDDSQLLLGEADVDDYPKQFLLPGAEGIVTTYPKATVEWEPSGDRSMTVTKEGDFIAKTSGSRTFPWRYVVCTETKGIMEQTLTLQLARKSIINDTSWIKPGKVSWEWWNGAAPYGPDVDFTVGNNYETYAYFVDFAAHYGLEYILLDEGWAQSTRDPFEGKPELHLQELIQYAKSRGVGIILWLPWLTAEQHMDLFKTYEKWGVAGVKIDFMDHADQWMVNYYKRIVAEAAKHHLVVDFHGAFTPAGLEYEYPNFLSYEGIRGLEYMGGCYPDNTLYHPFIRNAVGPADFTPGAMLNYQPELYQCGRPNSGSKGTRCHQLALYVVLESGVQMLADNPTLYYQNDDCARYISSVPVTWDETRCLAAEVGKYVVMAKRKGDTWFIGAIANGEESARTITVPLDFLNPGQHQFEAFKDGVNANFQAMHYNKVCGTVNSSQQLTITLAKNGGYAAVIKQ